MAKEKRQAARAKKKSPSEKLEGLLDNVLGVDGADPIFGEPWPDWLVAVCLRFARTFAPQFTVEDYLHHRERFLGLMLAYLQQVVSLAQAVPAGVSATGDFSKLLVQGLSEIAADGPDIQKKALSTAQKMDAAKQTEFFSAFGEGLKANLPVQSVQRLKETNTAKMCFFLILARPLIEAKEFKTSAAAFDTYCQIHAAFGIPAAPNEMARDSLKTQFASLCSECGIKFSGRARKTRQ